MHPLDGHLLPGQGLEPGGDRRHVLLELGHRVRGRAQPGQHGVDRERRRAGAQFLGERQVHRRDRLAEPVRLALEVPAGLVGAELRVGEQVAGRRGGHRPALGRVRRILGDHAERTMTRRLCQIRIGRLERAEQPRHVRIPRPAEDPVQLDVRIDAAGDPAEHLEDRVLLEDHAGVALLGVEHPRPPVQRQLRARLLLEGQVADRLTGVDQAQQEPRRLGGVEGVVRHPAVLVGADGGHRAVLRQQLGAPADDQLISLGAAVGVRDVDQHQLQIVPQWGGGRLFDVRQDPAASRVPALFR